MRTMKIQNLKKVFSSSKNLKVENLKQVFDKNEMLVVLEDKHGQTLEFVLDIFDFEFDIKNIKAISFGSVNSEDIKK